MTPTTTTPNPQFNPQPTPTLLTHDTFHKKADAILDLYIDHNIQQQETFHALHLLHQARNQQMNGI